MEKEIFTRVMKLFTSKGMSGTYKIWTFKKCVCSRNVHSSLQRDTTPRAKLTISFTNTCMVATYFLQNKKEIHIPS